MQKINKTKIYKNSSSTNYQDQKIENDKETEKDVEMDMIKKSNLFT